jgi:hypothetical protein
MVKKFADRVSGYCGIIVLYGVLADPPKRCRRAVNYGGTAEKPVGRMGVLTADGSVYRVDNK